MSDFERRGHRYFTRDEHATPRDTVRATYDRLRTAGASKSDARAISEKTAVQVHRSLDRGRPNPNRRE